MLDGNIKLRIFQSKRIPFHNFNEIKDKTDKIVFVFKIYIKSIQTVS